MNDALYEQLVTRKSRPMDLVIRILCIAALVVVLCGGMLFIGSLAVLVTILLGVLIYYFVFPKQMCIRDRLQCHRTCSICHGTDQDQPFSHPLKSTGHSTRCQVNHDHTGKPDQAPDALLPRHFL